MANEDRDSGDGRDDKGRWVKGRTGNPRGRPKNVPDLDMADVHNFAKEPIEIAVGGEKQRMTRHEIVMLKAFESAMRGRITAQKYLLEKFEQAEVSRGYVALSLERWAERIAEDPDAADPLEIRHLLRVAPESLQKRRSRIRKRTPCKRRLNKY